LSHLVYFETASSRASDQSTHQLTFSISITLAQQIGAEGRRRAKEKEEDLDGDQLHQLEQRRGLLFSTTTAQTSSFVELGEVDGTDFDRL